MAADWQKAGHLAQTIIVNHSPKSADIAGRHYLRRHCGAASADVDRRLIGWTN
jgi:hypothetical protein